MVFIILALFASWPYFEKFKEYYLGKRLLIGISIVVLLILGIMDIFNSDSQDKKYKKEISDSEDTISQMSNKIQGLDTMLAEFKTNQKDELAKISKDQQDRFDALNDRLTIALQENKGDIAEVAKDTTNDN